MIPAPKTYVRPLVLLFNMPHKSRQIHSGRGRRGGRGSRSFLCLLLISGYKFSMPRWLAGSLARWMGELWEIETPGRLKLHKTRDTRRTAFQVFSHDDGQFFHCLDFFHFFGETLTGILRYFLLEMVCRRGEEGTQCRLNRLLRWQKERARGGGL